MSNIEYIEKIVIYAKEQRESERKKVTEVDRIILAVLSIIDELKDQRDAIARLEKMIAEVING